MEETKHNKKITYIMIIVAIALFGYIAYAVIENNKNKDKNMENTDTTMTTESKISESGDIIVINYSGKLENGTEFDSSYKRGQPLVFQVGVGEVIPGWDEGLIGVKKGDKKTLNIPAEKGYGDQEIKNPQTGEVIIPKNSTLIFDVEVVEVIAKADAERMVAEQQAMQAAQGTSTAQ